VEKLKDTSVDKLKELLEKALEAEDYEKAAKIRDEINRRN
jgi:protein-arginine kinase activator protein McsA